jgi:rhodanese-related sulfurtransferase
MSLILGRASEFTYGGTVMPPEVLELSLPAVLEKAREDAIDAALPYAGGVTPAQAWALVSSGQAVLVDVRTNEERVFVGYVPGSVHVPWATGTALTRNPRFARELEAKLGGKDKIALLLCRSGKRSALAAEAATKAGLGLVFNVLEGFEGDLDEHEHRNRRDGWRVHELPWVQD